MLRCDFEGRINMVCRSSTRGLPYYLVDKERSLWEGSDLRGLL